MTVEPIGDGSRSRVSLDFNLEGQGIGKLIALLARRHARKTIPQDQERLTASLESGA